MSGAGLSLGWRGGCLFASGSWMCIRRMGPSDTVCRVSICLAWALRRRRSGRRRRYCGRRCRCRRGRRWGGFFCFIVANHPNVGVGVGVGAVGHQVLCSRSGQNTHTDIHSHSDTPPRLNKNQATENTQKHGSPEAVHRLHSLQPCTAMANTRSAPEGSPLPFLFLIQRKALIYFWLQLFFNQCARRCPARARDGMGDNCSALSGHSHDGLRKAGERAAWRSIRCNQSCSSEKSRSGHTVK